MTQLLSTTANTSATADFNPLVLPKDFSLEDEKRLKIFFERRLTILEEGEYRGLEWTKTQIDFLYKQLNGQEAQIPREPQYKECVVKNPHNPVLARYDFWHKKSGDGFYKTIKPKSCSSTSNYYYFLFFVFAGFFRMLYNG